MFRRLTLILVLAVVLSTALPGVASAAGVGESIVRRFWDGAMSLLQTRLESTSRYVTGFLESGEELILGADEDITTWPAVQDVYGGMRVAGLIVLAFCTVISLVEMTEAGISGQGGADLVGWFRRFFVATLLTFGGLQFYSIWIRLFNALLSVFRGYLDTHWTSRGMASDFYGEMARLSGAAAAPMMFVPFVVLVIVILIVLYFMVGGIRKAEMIICVMLAPLVWPLYLIRGVDDIPKTAFRGFLGLNATLLIVVAMVRLSLRIAFGSGTILNVWQLVPALSLLVMTIFLPSIVKRIVGQGHSGTGALVTGLQLLAGYKFLALAKAGGAAAAGSAVSPPAAAAVPSPPVGSSPHPPTAIGAGQAGSSGALGQTPTVYQQARIRSQLASGARAGSRSPGQLEAPVSSADTVIDMGEAVPGSGKFDVTAIRAARAVHDGSKAYRPNSQSSGGEL